MNMRLLMYNLFFLVILLTSCDFSYDKRLDKTDYYIGWANGKEYTTLYFGDEDVSEGIILPRITDVYWNKKYILAKRCKLYSDTLVGYYILKIVEYGKEKASPNIFGPFSTSEYEQKKSELHLNEKEMKHINLFDWKYVFQ